MFGEAKPFTGFPEGCQEESVPLLLLALVSMILEGPNIKEQMADTNSAAIASAQILKFKSGKHKRTRGTTPSTSVRHNVAQETPFPIYRGMMLHAHTRKKILVDRLSHLGLSISYDRVLQLSAQMGNSVCQQFHRRRVVCPLRMSGKVFTTAAVDNIDHNPSATTSKDSFHGTAISLIQHPSYAGTFFSVLDERQCDLVRLHAACSSSLSSSFLSALFCALCSLVLLYWSLHV